DNATSCSSENSVIAVAAIADQLLAALVREGGVMLDAEETRRLEDEMFGEGKLANAVIAQDAPAIAAIAGLVRSEMDSVRFLIVDQAHCFATGGSYDNALPFSLSMGCGTWGGNSISDNLNYRHFLNITRVVHPLAAERVREPTEDDLFGDYRRRHRI